MIHGVLGIGSDTVAALRPVLLVAAAAVGAAVVTGPAGPAFDPRGPVTEYALRAAVAVLVVAGAVAWWWSHRRGREWGADLAPAVAGAVAGLTVAVALHRTPYPPGGLDADQTFRAAAITRFADDWRLADFTFADLPSFYAPAYFWVAGRAADLVGAEPWRVGKVGTLAVALAVPVVTYLLWRRLVPVHTAALVALVPLAVQSFYEPYAWLVLVAIVPWWLEAVHGLRRPGRQVGNPVFLGLVGALLFLTYYYFFFIAALALLLHLVVEWAPGRALGRAHGTRRWRQLGRAALVLGIAAAASAVYWLPLAVSMLRADQVQSLANRWFAESHPHLPLPMTEASATGAVALFGLAYLVWTVRRDALSRGLLVLLAAAYGWYALGAAAAAADTPLLSFRGKPLVPLILLTAGVLGLVRLAAAAARRFDTADVRRVGLAVGTVVVVAVAQGFVSDVRDSPLTEAAHATALPDGSLPPYHPDDVELPQPPAAELRAAVDEVWAGQRRPVVLSDRADLLALYPLPGYLQWNAHYAHPASGFERRAAYLRRLADAETPAAFAAGARDAPYEPVDVFVLSAEGDDAVLRYAADAFPHGVRTAEIRFPRALFDGDGFATVEVGDYLVAAVP